ncbi:fasciclin domain-containing protein [Aeromicrobium sp. CF4.19]|uniref:fasciclin domain-containing protein n=1 Tax=Aeromicrobium sp. CF4.19 TaxID=3373082 RepID=UPI003EE5B251
MRTTKTGKTLAIAAVSSLALFTAACGSSDDDTSSDTATEEAPEEEGADDVAADLAGPGCEDYAAENPEGAGSVEGMAQEPVATAAGGNPLLTQLVSAVSGELNPDVDLVDTLNGGEFTVFAPVDDAFAALPEDTVATLQTPEGAETLSSVLTYHVVEGQMTPDEIAGQTFTTVNGAELSIEGEADALTVGPDGANVICGGVKTANATVYLIDAVMMPPA